MSDSPHPPKLAYEPPDDERPASAAAPPPEVLEAKPAHDPYAALRYPDFCLYLAGWVVSVIGSQVLEVAVAWNLYQRTHLAITLAWVGLVAAAPIILLALPAGQIADRFDRRRIMVYTQSLSIACAVGLGILSMYATPLIFVFAVLFMAGVAKAIGWPARTALVPSLVPLPIFPNAIAWNTTAFETAAMAGPALGGILVAWNHTVPFFVTAMCGVVFVITTLLIRKRPAPSRREPATLKSLGAGIQFVVDNQIILAIITLDLFAVLLGGATYILPIFATKILAVGARGFGWLRASPALGAILCALVLAHLPPLKRAGRSLLLAVTGFGVAMIIFGLSRNFWLSMAMLFLTGIFDNISVFVRHTLVQSLTPDSMRGRVSAVNNIFVGASNELGGFESGLTAQIFGPIISVVGGGIGTLVVVGLITYIWPQVRRFGSLADARPIEEKSHAEAQRRGESEENSV
jgi:MFS family permease